MTSRVAPGATFRPRATAIFSSRPETRAAMSIRVLSASPWTSNGSGRTRYRIASPIIVRKTTTVTMARGLSRGLRLAVSARDPVVARSSVGGGAMDGGASVIVFQRLQQETEHRPVAVFSAAGLKRRIAQRSNKG